MSTDASREAPVDNEWICNLGYAIYAVRSRLCNLRYATRLSTGASREASVTMSVYDMLCYAIYVEQSKLSDLARNSVVIFGDNVCKHLFLA